MILDLTNKNHTNASCKGLVYKYKQNYFRNSMGDIVFQERFVPLKRQSCKGCEMCGFLLESLNENISCGVFPIIPEGLSNGDVVFLTTTILSRDYETGYADDWCEEFVKIEEKES